MLQLTEIPGRLQRIPQPPKVLFSKGADLYNLLSYPCVTVVGSRKLSAYGKQVTETLVTDLVKAGIVIISGLAIGVDGLAHRAALAAHGGTIAVLPGGLDRIYPRCHYQLAAQILRQGGALVSEYPAGTESYPAHFIARNRLASGLGNALLVTEAAAKSGTLHTARFALEQGKDVFAVPGNITSSTSEGTNNLIKAGASPATSATDIVRALGLETAGKRAASQPIGDTPEQQQLIDLLATGIQDGEALLTHSHLDVSRFNQALTMLELAGTIRPLGNNQWSL